LPCIFFVPGWDVSSDLSAVDRDADLDRRVRAREHEREPMVRNDGIGRRRGVELLGEKLQVGGRTLGASPSPDGVDHFAPRGREEPPFGVRGVAPGGPVLEGRCERLGERIFGGRYVVHLDREKGDELAVAPPRDRFGRKVRIDVGSLGAHSIMSAPARRGAPPPLHDRPPGSARPTRLRRRDQAPR
jgi:hypothetical protein